jgi:hypothetical protein
MPQDWVGPAQWTSRYRLAQRLHFPSIPELARARLGQLLPALDRLRVFAPQTRSHLAWPFFDALFALCMARDVLERAIFDFPAGGGSRCTRRCCRAARVPIAAAKRAPLLCKALGLEKPVADVEIPGLVVPQATFVVLKNTAARRALYALPAGPQPELQP